MRPLPLATPVRPLIKIEGAKTDVHALEGALELTKCKLPYIEREGKRDASIADQAQVLRMNSRFIVSDMKVGAYIVDRLVRGLTGFV